MPPESNNSQSGPQTTDKSFILNCTPSARTEDDWTFEDAATAGIVKPQTAPPAKIDLRTSWWNVDHQGNTGACVGFSTAYGVLRWHFVKDGRLPKSKKPSARFIWMANKETDQMTSFPTTFIETAGSQTKRALKIARKFGCVTDDELPMSGKLSPLSRVAFYARASRFKISSFYNLGSDLGHWRIWLATQGPILTRLRVDRTWNNATRNHGNLRKYQPRTRKGGHAVCLVGYTKDHFIVRNSWGPQWGDAGFAYASNAYTEAAFTEAYGAVL